MFLESSRPRYDFFNPIEGKGQIGPIKDGPGPGPVKSPPQPGKKDPVIDLPMKVQKLPIVVQHKSKDKTIKIYARDDNSNTQFGLLGLWAARRHGVASDVSLELAARRFHQTQNGNGGWGYVARGPSKNTMTCVGLLGLAMGHGSAAEALAEAAAKGKAAPRVP